MGLNALAVTGFPAIYVSLGYRLAPAAKHPAQVEDCLEAVAWLADNAASFGGDAARIHIGGHSAGAHIATLAALRTDLHAAHGVVPETIRSCFAYSGLYDLRGAHDRPVVPGLSPVPMLADLAGAHDASPLLSVGHSSTRFHVSWGMQEIDDFKNAGAVFAEALRTAGNVVTVDTPDLDHFWIHLDQVRPLSAWNVALRHEMTRTPKQGGRDDGRI